MIEVINEINLKTIMWIIPLIFFFHEMEEWNILDWYHSTYRTPPPSTKLSTRIWMCLISVWGFVITAISYIIPNTMISAMVILFLVVFTTFNGLQHIYWTIAFKKYAPGVIWSSMGIIAGLVVTVVSLAQNQGLMIYILLLYLIAIPKMIQTIRAKNSLTKTFYKLHVLTVKIADCFER